jgi:class 3 adenylate cyclase/predicted ATPase
MQQVADWLEKLGLGQYAQRFAENDIGFVILPDLTDQDLEKIGVASLGHRRLLLRAIGELDSVGKRTPKPESAPAAHVVAPHDIAERRQITVMFSDLVGSTALSARMDPDDLRFVISVYQKCVAETVQRFGGFVAKYMGDGVLVYFGYPQAHEHDAERAVRAGLELIRAVGDLKSGTALQTRVGIATGLVVVGDLIGSGTAQEQAVVGETPNIAARLQSIADPNAVVIAESTRKLLGNLFDLQDLGGQDLKGIGVPVRAWAALPPASVESRFDALHASGLTELVGRGEELDLLLRRWSKAKAGEGQVVLLSGEAGIGKSRLTAGLMERVVSESHTRLRYFCSPRHTDSALYPVIGQMERAAGLAHGDTAQVKFDKLVALLAQTSTSTQDVSLLADMLSLPNEGRYRALEMTPEQRRKKTLEALGSQMEALSRSNPVLMIFEDAHWADPTSLEVVSRVVDRLRNLRVLLIVTFRPEFDPPWIGRPHVAAVTLNRLAQRDIETVIDNVVGNKLIPASIRQDIIERTDGIPLFVEEMTKAVLEAGNEGAAQQTVASFPSPALAVPASLQASLMARLDRLGAAKELAQVGAAIGRKFSHALLSAVVSKSEPALVLALDRLIASGLLFRQGVPPHSSYLFNHALVQDAAYGTLLREPRRVLHARIAETLEVQFPEIAENQPELLARHCTEAGLIEKAARLWGRAGQRSLDRSALVEAVAQFTRALDQITLLPATPALRREQIRLQVALITPLIHVKGYAAPETKAAAERAHRLIEQAQALGEPPDDPLLLFSVLYSFCIANYIAFNGAAMRELATQFLTLAEKEGTTVPLMIGHRMMGIALFATGDIEQGRDHSDRAFRLYDSAAHRSLGTRFGQDVGVSILSYRAYAQWVLGYPNAAIIDAERALRDAREIGQASTLMYALSHTGFIHVTCGIYRAATSEVDELAASADEKASPFWAALGLLNRGYLCALTGEASDAVRSISSGLAALRSTGSRMWAPFYLAYLAYSRARLGQFDDAWRCIDDAVSEAEGTMERWYEPELQRIGGTIALKQVEPDVGKAEAHFERALAVARRQQAKSWELRAAMSMARFWRDQGKRDEARDLLAPVYDWFTEGFDTLDLKEAKSLLDGLSA